LRSKKYYHAKKYTNVRDKVLKEKQERGFLWYSWFSRFIVNGFYTD